MRLLPLNRGDAFDAVHEPAKDLMTAALAKRVVDIVAGENLHREGDTAVAGVEHRGDGQGASHLEPALLSLFCRELNGERKRLGQERFEEQLVENARSGILSNYYSACVRDLPHVAEFVEDELITEKGFRNSYAREDAVPSILTDDELGRLIGSRLLRLVEYHGAQRIELTHDVLTKVVREHRDRRRAEEEKAALAARAEQERQALEQAAAQRQAELDREREARLESERAGRRLKRLSAVLALVCVVAVVLALWAWHNSDLAKRAREAANARRVEALAERLASQGLAILTGGQPGGELEAIDKLLEAQHISTSPDVVGSPLTALSRKARLQKVLAMPPEGTFSTDTRTATVYGHLTAEGQHVITRTKAGFQILDTQTGEHIGPPFANPDDIIGGVSPNGRYLAMVGKDYSIHIFDSDSREPFGPSLPGNDSVFPAGVAVSSDGRHVAAADSESTARLWDTQTGRQIASLVGRQDAKVTALVFSPDGRSLATAGNEYTVRLWDSENGAALRETTRAGDERMEKNDQIVSLAFSPDGHTIAGGGATVGQGPYFSAGSPLRLWNADTGEAIGTPLADNYGMIRSIAFSPAGDRIATAGSDKMIRTWDAHTGQPIGDTLTFQFPLRDVAFTRQGNRIVSVSGDTIETSDVDPDVRLPVETHGSKMAHLADGSTAFALYVMKDASRIAVFNEGSLRWLDPDTGDQIGRTVVSDALREIKQFNQFDMSSDKRWLAVAEPDHTVRILDASNGQPNGGLLKGHDDAINAATFSPDGQVIATASDDKTVRLWDWRNGRQIGEPMKGHKDRVQVVEFSNDGHRLVSVSDDSIRMWDTTNRRAIGKPIGGPGSSYIFSTWALRPDGRRIAATTPFTIQQWDADTGEPVGSPMLGNNDKTINDITYSPDGRYLVSISNDRTLRFWDTRSDQQIGEPVDITAVGPTYYVHFSHDARRVFIRAVPVSLKGSPPYVGGGIWQIPTPTVWADALCDKVVTNPSDQQWKDWISPDIPYQEPCPGKRRSQ
jgi:WD40 repeat protein